MNKQSKARKYNSLKLQSLLEEVTPLVMEQTKMKMKLAAQIEDLMQARGWSKSQFAEKIGKNPSEITKWLSGTQNFTIDVLIEIAFTLGVELATLFGKKQDKHISIEKIIVKSSCVSTDVRLTTLNGKHRVVHGFRTNKRDKTIHSKQNPA